MNESQRDDDHAAGGVHAMQRALADAVRVRDDFAKPLRVIAGFEIGLEHDGAVTRAAAVLLDMDTLQPIAGRIARVPSTNHDGPNLPTFRKMPALLAVLAQLPQRPDLAMIGGHGIAHPHGLGIASHFGVVADLPSIGVATRILAGTGPEPHEVRGAYTALRRDGAQIGWILRSKTQCRPLIVSPGHRVAMASAADLVMRCVTRYRLPEPTRLAGRGKHAAAGDAGPFDELADPPKR